MDTLNRFEIFMLMVSTPFIVAAVWHMFVKYYGNNKQNQKGESEIKTMGD